MTSKDPELGLRIHNILVQFEIETPMATRPEIIPEDMSVFEAIESCTHTTMSQLGLDMEDDSLKDTPHRIAKMYCSEIFTGLDYRNFPRCSTFQNKMKVDEMVAVNNISVMSMCEHHLLPFIGTACVGYIPNEMVLGLSKFNRIVDFFSRRPQVQERLTQQIAYALQEILETEDVALVIRADHYCVKLRGVMDDGTTTTSSMSGRFFTNHSLRQEFLSLTR